MIDEWTEKKVQDWFDGLKYFSQEVQVLLVRTVLVTENKIWETKAFRKWCLENKNILDNEASTTILSHASHGETLAWEVKRDYDTKA